VFVQCDELPQRRRSQLLQEDHAGRTVAFECSVWRQPCGCAIDLDFLGRFSESQRLCLGKHVGQEQVVVAAERVKRLNKPDEVAGDELGPLMNQLVEGMLAIGARDPFPILVPSVMRESGDS